MTWVGDYSWARPKPAALVDAGCVGVIRYLGPGNKGRDIMPPERDALHGAGLGIGLVWETTTTAALAGWQAGWSDFAAANRYADALGVPADHPIFFAVDTDVTPAQARGPVADTLRGAMKASKRPVRPYGEFDVLEVLCGELRLVPCGWQCAAWSGGRKSVYRCMYQKWPPVMDDTVDHNDIGPMPNDFLWHPDKPFERRHVEAMAATVPQEDDDMKSLIAWTKPDSAWGRDVAGGKGESMAFECWGLFARPLSPDTVALRKFLGVEDKGEVEDGWFKSFTLIPNDKVA